MLGVVHPLLDQLLSDAVLLAALYLGCLVSLRAVQFLSSTLIGHRKF